jgi:hypothetical protein
MDDKIVDKIRKLKAKAEGTSNEAEAEIFNQKVQELMHQHNITHLGVETDRVQKDTGSIYSDAWRQHLVTAISEANFCSAMMSERRRPNGRKYNQLGFLGSADNVEAAMAQYHILEKTVVNMAKAYSPHRAQRLSYERGMGTRLAVRVVERHRAAMAQEQPSGGGGLPAVVDQEQHLNEKYMEDRNFKRRKSTQHTKTDHHTVRGYRDGDRVNMEDQLK